MMGGGWGMAGGRPDGRIGMDRAEVIDNQASIRQGAKELSQTNCIGGGRSLHGFDSQSAHVSLVSPAFGRMP